MNFDLYAPAAMPPKPAADKPATTKDRAAACGAPHILGLRWSKNDDGAVWAWRTNSWKDLHRGDAIDRLREAGLRQVGFAEIFFDASKDPAAAEAVVKQLQAEARAFAKAARARKPAPPPPIPEVVDTRTDEEIEASFDDFWGKD